MGIGLDADYYYGKVWMPTSIMPCNWLLLTAIRDLNECGMRRRVYCIIRTLGIGAVGWNMFHGRVGIYSFDGAVVAEVPPSKTWRVLAPLALGTHDRGREVAWRMKILAMHRKNIYCLFSSNAHCSFCVFWQCICVCTMYMYAEIKID